MRIIKHSIIICLSLFSIANICLAQTPEGNLRSEEIDIIKPYQPILADAVKISFTPQPPKNDINVEALSYDINPKLPTIQYLAPSLKPVAVSKDANVEVLPTLFAKLGFGNYTQPYINAAYSNTKKKGLQFGINVLHHSARSKQIVDQQFSDNGLKIFINKYSKKWVQNGNVNINYNTRKPYAAAINSNRLKENVTKSFNFIEIAPSYTIQNYQEKNKGLWLSSQITPWLYKSKYNYAAKSASEMGLDIANKFVYPFNNNKAILNFNIAYNNINFSEDLFITSSPNKDRTSLASLKYGEDFKLMQKNLLVTVNPYYQINKKYWQLEMGVNAGLNGKIASFYPHYQLSYQLIKNSVTIYNGYKGAITKNTYKKMMLYNPFTNYFAVRNTLGHEGFLGVMGIINNKLSYNARFAIQFYKHLPFLINESSTGLPLFSVNYNPEIAQIFNSHAHLKYNLFTFVTLEATVDHYQFLKPASYYHWHQPSLVGSVAIKYQANKKLLISSSCVANNASKSKLGTNELNIPGYVNWNSDVSYRFHKNINAFVSLNNILNNKNARFYGYPNFGINGLIGVVINY
jgi:hypothetical protein